jgi:hypothetical protein
MQVPNLALVNMKRITVLVYSWKITDSNEKLANIHTHDFMKKDGKIPSDFKIKKLFIFSAISVLSKEIQQQRV